MSIFFFALLQYISHVAAEASHLDHLSSAHASSNIFLKFTMRIIDNPTDLISFQGSRAMNMLRENSIILSSSSQIQYWSDLLSHVDSKVRNSTLLSLYHGIHIHNDVFSVGDLLQLVMKEFSKHRSIWNKKMDDWINIPMADIHKVMGRGDKPFIITNGLNENWGFLSGAVGTRTTTRWVNMTNHLRIHNVDRGILRHFLDSEKILLLVTNTHVDPLIGAHRKILSLPLGIKARIAIFHAADRIYNSNLNKTKLLMINNSGWGDRKKINEQVIAAFNGTVSNSYAHPSKSKSKSKLQSRAYDEHYSEIATSQFVLCPSGLGMDTYRLWETLFLGSIPVVESNAGLDRTYSSLPVLVINDYSELTPELLQRAFPCFVKHAHEFKYEHLREEYWLNLLANVTRTGVLDQVDENHPFRNKYCDFRN
eukprot:gene4936-9853_t